MPALTIRNIPDELYRRLEDRARLNRRSLSSEAIALLERGLGRKRRSIEETVAALQRLHARLGGLPPLDDDFLASAKGEGRS